MKNVNELHTTLLNKAREIAAKHNCFAVLPSTAKHTESDYTAKIRFIEKMKSIKIGLQKKLFMLIMLQLYLLHVLVVGLEKKLR